MHSDLDSPQKNGDKNGDRNYADEFAHLEPYAVALVGAPNSGKTTLFNWLTGAKFRTVNYPGATVEYSVGETQARWGVRFTVMDTPGTYSLLPKSPEEQVTVDALFAHPNMGSAPVVISVVDATQLARHLLLPRQLRAAGFIVVVALTMKDLIHEQGMKIDAEALSLALGCSVIEVDGRLGGGVGELTRAASEALKKAAKRSLPLLTDWSEADTENVLREAVNLAAGVVQSENSNAQTGTADGPTKKMSSAQQRTRQIDQVLLHPVWGLVFFALIMGTLFSGIFWFARPLMDLVSFVFDWSGDQINLRLPHSLLGSLLADGILASFSAVLVFVPQIFILFVGISAFEDSGYLARAATLIDRPFSKLGLNGRSFIPLLSAYACAVPAMMAARTINSRRERWITLFIIPLMSCSARLPVYALLLTFLFPNNEFYAGLALTGLYFCSLVVGGLAAAVLNRILPRDGTSLFMLELPLYRRPMPKQVLNSAYIRTRSYVKRAGVPIFCFAMALWTLTTFPNWQEQNKTLRLQNSYAARVGQLIEPIFVPMGGDWRTGMGLAAAFAAREVFVSSLAVVMGVTGDDSSGSAASAGAVELDAKVLQRRTLTERMTTAVDRQGRRLFTVSSVLGLIVFFMLALQCLSTTAMATRESGQLKFALIQLVAFNVIAYVVAVALVQSLRALGVA